MNTTKDEFQAALRTKHSNQDAIRIIKSLISDAKQIFSVIDKDFTRAYSKALRTTYNTNPLPLKGPLFKAQLLNNSVMWDSIVARIQCDVNSGARTDYWKCVEELETYIQELITIRDSYLALTKGIE